MSDKNILKLNEMCESARIADIGTKLDSLNNAINSDTVKSYNGEDLTEQEVKYLNNMCAGATKIQLGTLLYNLLNASKNGENLDNITDKQAHELNHICSAIHECQLGTFIKNAIESLNQSETKIASLSEQDGSNGDIGNGAGQENNDSETEGDE